MKPQIGGGLRLADPQVFPFFREGNLIEGGTVRRVALAPEEALAFGEQPLQLRENGSAEFVLEGVPLGWRLREGGECCGRG